MNRTIQTLALAVFAICGFSVSAQNQNSTCGRQTCYETTCPPTAGSDSRIRGPQNWRERAFEGVLLSVDQQAKMDEINKEFESRFATICSKCSCKADKATCGKAKCCTQDCDKANCGRTGCDKGRAGRRNAPGFKVRSEYIARVKEVLTPEQYTTFLENIVNMPVKQNCRKGDPRLRSTKSDYCTAKCRIAHEARKFNKDAKKDLKRAAKIVKNEARKLEEKVENAAE